MSEQSEKVDSGFPHPERLLPLNVFVMADETLMRSPSIIEAARSGIQDVVCLMKTSLQVKLMGNSWGEGDYGSVGWFIQHARRVGREGSPDLQILYNDLHGDLSRDPSREKSPHLGFMLLSEDMTAVLSDNKALNFIFGHADKEIGQSVQSVFRFIKRGLSEEELALTTRHIARHEFGHLVGLDGDTILNQDKRSGIYKGHCANNCTMH